MARKQFFAVVDTETTSEDTVADFACVIVDRNGETHAQCAVLVKDHFDAKDLFADNSVGGLWSTANLSKRRAAYNTMLNEGSRMLASVAAINRWMEKANAKFSPVLTAYNLPFDADKCARTGIDLSIFADRFCLWAAAVGMICQSRKYRDFVLANHLFNSPTELGNMTYKTNAESVAGFLTGNLSTEPHTALEDALFYEVPILRDVVKRKKWRENIISYDWKKHQVKDHFKAS